MSAKRGTRINPTLLSQRYCSPCLLTVITGRDVTESLFQALLVTAVTTGLGVVHVVLEGVLVELEPLHIDAVLSARLNMFHLQCPTEGLSVDTKVLGKSLRKQGSVVGTTQRIAGRVLLRHMIYLVVMPLFQSNSLVPVLDGEISWYNSSFILGGRIWQVHLHGLHTVVEHAIQQPEFLNVDEGGNNLGAELNQRIIVTPENLLSRQVEYRL